MKALKFIFKRMSHILLVTFFCHVVYAQDMNYIPNQTIVAEGPWATAIEARNIPLESMVIEALYTKLMNSTEVDHVVKTASMLEYTTPLGDKVYFVLSQEGSPSRVVTISRVPATNIGVILRLDNNMLQAAHYFASVVEGKEQDIFNIFAGNTGKFYYTSKKGQYARVYLDQTVNEGFIPVVSGYLIIPANSQSFGFRMGEYNHTKCKHSVALKFEDTQVASYTFNVDKQGFNLGLIYSENKPAGTYRYKVSFHGPYSTWNCPPGDRFRFWFECFGEEMMQPVNIDGNPQPFLQSRAFSELKIPR